MRRVNKIRKKVMMAAVLLIFLIAIGIIAACLVKAGGLV